MCASLLYAFKHTLFAGNDVYVPVCVCTRVCVCVLRRAGWLTGGTYRPINFTWARYHQPQMPIDA